MKTRAVAFLLLVSTSIVAVRAEQPSPRSGDIYRLTVSFNRCVSHSEKPEIAINVRVDEPFFAKAFAPWTSSPPQQSPASEQGQLYIVAGLLSRDRDGQLQVVFSLLDWSSDRNNVFVNGTGMPPNPVALGNPIAIAMIGGLGRCYTLLFEELDGPPANTTSEESLRRRTAPN